MDVLFYFMGLCSYFSHKYGWSRDTFANPRSTEWSHLKCLTALPRCNAEWSDLSHTCTQSPDIFAVLRSTEWPAQSLDQVIGWRTDDDRYTFCQQCWGRRRNSRSSARPVGVRRWLCSVPDNVQLIDVHRLHCARGQLHLSRHNERWTSRNHSSASAVKCRLLYALHMPGANNTILYICLMYV